jgi:predicted negative regulator of RcsB-dependent stress response
MDRCAMEFIARRWWRRVEVWVIAMLLIIGGGFFGFQISQWSLASSYLQQVASVRSAYDEALKQRDLRLNRLAENTGKAAEKVEAAASTATQAASTATHAADTASKAADKADAALERATQ